MKSQISNLKSQILQLLLLFLAGCASAPPPAPSPAAVTAANRAATQAAALSERQNWPGAAREWKRAIDQFALLNDRAGEATALHNLAQAESELGNFGEARRHLEQASSLNEKLGRQEDWWRNQIALLQVEARAQDTQALERRFEKLTPPKPGLLHGLFLNELGLWQQNRGDLDKAAETFEQARREFETARDSSGLAAVLANRAQLYEQQKNYNEAIQTWRSALAGFESLADPRGITRSLAGLGRSLVAADRDPGLAEEYLRRAVGNYRTLNMPKESQATLQVLEKSLMAQGKTREAEQLRTEFPMPR